MVQMIQTSMLQHNQYMEEACQRRREDCEESSPYERRGSNRNNPQHEGLMQMMQMSMLQHNQYMEEGCQRRREDCEDCLAMQHVLADAVGGAMAALNSYISHQQEELNSRIKFLLV
jgi:hypothetical protein